MRSQMRVICFRVKMGLSRAFPDADAGPGEGSAAVELAANACEAVRMAVRSSMGSGELGGEWAARLQPLGCWTI